VTLGDPDTDDDNDDNDDLAPLVTVGEPIGGEALLK
jgi:hypothetical protein